LPKVNPARKTKAVRARRPRRTTEEIIDLVIDAACEEFERNGYEGTKTATIARRAGVAEALIFSNFGTKAKLFYDSIFKPLDRHFLRFRVAHTVAPDDTEGMKKGTQQYIFELQQFIGRHSRMLKSVIAAQMYACGSVQGLSQIEGLHDFFSRASSTATSRRLDNPKIDPKLIVRISFATILACVIFKDWLFPKGLASEAEIRAAISDFIMEGLAANARSSSEAKAPARSRRSPGVAGSKRKRRPGPAARTAQNLE